MANEPAIAYEEMTPMVHFIRGKRVMLDSDLDRIYGVSTMRLNEQFKRNRERFPDTFAYQLTRQEFATLTSQFAISRKGRGGRQSLPWVFTEHGAVMLACVLKSPVAVAASVRIVNAFFYLREQLSANADLAKKFAELENRLNGHDETIAELFEAIRLLLDPAAPKPQREIGFHAKENAVKYRIKKN
ncbi:MAG TPA: ORF6N domain-containing protein [Verrucomicrobiae bacterium]|nr:ORF6N domain-containing protein [Verrucomicrobiae bacterium]